MKVEVPLWDGKIAYVEKSAVTAFYELSGVVQISISSGQVFDTELNISQVKDLLDGG